LNQEDSKDNSGAGFVDSLRDIQGEYIMLGDLYEKQKSYGSKLSELMKTLQFEVDTIIPIRPEALGKPARAAYLVSEAVVVVFDQNGGLTSKPLYTLPPDVIVSIIQECTPELQRLLSEKRRIETNKVRSMERVLKELKKAQSTFKQTKRDELEPEEEEMEEPEIEKARPPETRAQKEVESAPQQRQGKDSFTFRGNFGEKHEIPPISP
jgi:Sec-independent protein translocase protein TatA